MGILKIEVKKKVYNSVIGKLLSCDVVTVANMASAILNCAPNCCV